MDTITAPELTREQILAMPAGREMDCLIAERIFGCTKIGYYGPPEDGPWLHDKSVRFDTPELAQQAYKRHWERNYKEKPFGVMDPDDERNFDEPTYWKEGWGPLAIHYFSTDIAAAWQVVEKLTKGMIRFRFEQPRIGRIYAKFIDCNSPATIIIGGAGAETAPLAICRAALMSTIE